MLIGYESAGYCYIFGGPGEVNRETIDRLNANKTVFGVRTENHLFHTLGGDGPYIRHHLSLLGILKSTRFSNLYMSFRLDLGGNLSDTPANSNTRDLSDTIVYNIGLPGSCVDLFNTRIDGIKVFSGDGRSTLWLRFGIHNYVRDRLSVSAYDSKEYTLTTSLVAANDSPKVYGSCQYRQAYIPTIRLGCGKLYYYTERDQGMFYKVLNNAFGGAKGSAFGFTVDLYPGSASFEKVCMPSRSGKRKLASFSLINIAPSSNFSYLKSRFGIKLYPRNLTGGGYSSSFIDATPHSPADVVAATRFIRGTVIGRYARELRDGTIGLLKCNLKYMSWVTIPFETDFLLRVANSPYIPFVDSLEFGLCSAVLSFTGVAQPVGYVSRSPLGSFAGISTGNTVLNIGTRKKLFIQRINATAILGLAIFSNWKFKLSISVKAGGSVNTPKVLLSK